MHPRPETEGPLPVLHRTQADTGGRCCVHACFRHTQAHTTCTHIPAHTHGSGTQKGVAAGEGGADGRVPVVIPLVLGMRLLSANT